MFQSEVHLIKVGDKVGASEATLLNMLGISPFSYGLVIQQGEKLQVVPCVWGGGVTWCGNEGGGAGSTTRTHFVTCSVKLESTTPKMLNAGLRDLVCHTNVSYPHPCPGGGALVL